MKKTTQSQAREEQTEESLHQGHDSLFKRIFSRRPWLAALLRVSLPERVADAIDWSSLELVPTELVKQDLRRVYSDLAARAAWRDQPGVVLLDLEHKSRMKRLTAFDSFERCMGLARWALEDDPDATTVPCVIPLLVAHAGRPWSAPLELGELVGLPEDHPAAGMFQGPRLILDDLSATPSAALAARDLPDVPLLALFFLKNARDATDLLAELELVVPELRRVTSAPELLADAASLLYYLGKVANVPAEQLQRFLRDKVSPQAELSFVKSAEELHDEGKAEGLVEGKAEGLVEGKAKALLRILNRRGIALAAGQEQQILACRNLEVLDAWLDKALDAKTAEEVLG